MDVEMHVNVSRHQPGFRMPLLLRGNLCRCGHRARHHHNGVEECEFYDCNEGAGMGPDGRDRCHNHVDRDDPASAVRGEPGTFTHLARAAGWCRAIGHVARALIIGRKLLYQRGIGGSSR